MAALRGPVARSGGGEARRGRARSRAWLLAVETSGGEPSVALFRGGELVAERRARAGRPGSEPLLPAIDRLLRAAGCRVADLEAFAVSAGPGSFTGLRVGIATVKGLAFGSGAPVAPVPTLAAIAQRAPVADAPVVAVSDARRGEVYAAAFVRAGGELEAALLPEGLYTPEDLCVRLPLRLTLVGDGVAVCGGRLRAALGPGVRLVPASRARPRAREVGLLGLRLLARGQGVDAAALVPRYVRRAEAEARRTGARREPAGG